MSELEMQVLNILRSNTGDQKEISLSDELQQIGINSIAFIKVVVNIENEFGIEFKDEELNLKAYKNIGELITSVRSKMPLS